MSIRRRRRSQPRNRNRVRCEQQAAVQLAKLGGRIGVPLEQHPEYLQAKAARDEAQRQLDHTVVKAPFDGTVTQVSSLQPGAMIVSSLAAFMPTSAVALVGDGAKWVEANLKETDLTYVHPGSASHDHDRQFSRPRVARKRDRPLRRPPARNSRCCRRKIPAATGSKSCSGFRFASASMPVRTLAPVRAGMSVSGRNRHRSQASHFRSAAMSSSAPAFGANQHPPPFAGHGLHHDRDPDAGARQHHRQCRAASYAGQPRRQPRSDHLGADRPM